MRESGFLTGPTEAHKPTSQSYLCSKKPPAPKYYGYAGGTAPRDGLLDPRSLVLLTFATNIVVMNNNALWVLLVCIATTALFSIFTVPLRIFIWWASLIAVCCICAFVVPAVAPNYASVSLGFVAFWFLKFGITVILAVSFFTAVTAQQVASVLTRLRVPSFIYVPVMVMFRFFPVAHDELIAIRQAMLLRGLQPGFRAMTVHPVRHLELMIIPFLLSATRIVDELSAAALIKAVGAGKSINGAHRTTIVPVRFTRYDALALGLCAMVVAAKGTHLWAS